MYVDQDKDNETNIHQEGTKMDGLWLVSDDDQICVINWPEVCVSVVKFKLALNIDATH